ncbi:MAG: hypothetical protein Q9M91_07370 [Candidatus Dojkabacteria bacterium]|nr:hypothetical protein [Candidatus Dojkabacteria bacterium]MDQ7021607.1 hypothetical protein [Candidatus Dojkabacteria bacterium]
MKFNLKEATEVTSKLTIKDLKQFYKDFIKVKPIFWFVSPYNDEEIYKIFKQSKYYKNFKE